MLMYCVRLESMATMPIGKICKLKIVALYVSAWIKIRCVYMTRQQSIIKSISIEEALNKIGWSTDISFSGCEASTSFYITISKWINKGSDNEEEFSKKIRFSDHELPAYYALADYECRFDINGASWSKLKPVLKKLYNDIN